MGDRYDIGVDTAEVKFRCWNRDDQERLLNELDPMAHDIWQKPIEGTISFDVGEGEDKSMMSVYDIKTGKYEFSAEVSEHSRDILRMLFGGWSEEFNAQSVAFNRLLKTYEDWAKWIERFCSLARKGKRRKTTYKTIRRDCAKRNRHK